MNTSLQDLIHNNPAIWRAGDLNNHSALGSPTGYPQLDAVLPGGGWPKNSLIEIISPQWGIGELQLILPLMAQASQQDNWMMWVLPPFIPYAPALTKAGIDIKHSVVIKPECAVKDALWGIEKALQSDDCSMVLAWLDSFPDGVIRRLQLAAEASNTPCFLYRKSVSKHSYAPLRLQLQASQHGVHVQVLKSRSAAHRYQSVYLNTH